MKLCGQKIGKRYDVRCFHRNKRNDGIIFVFIRKMAFLSMLVMPPQANFNNKARELTVNALLAKNYAPLSFEQIRINGLLAK